MAQAGSPDCRAAPLKAKLVPEKVTQVLQAQVVSWVAKFLTVPQILQTLQLPGVRGRALRGVPVRVMARLTKPGAIWPLLFRIPISMKVQKGVTLASQPHWAAASGDKAAFGWVHPYRGPNEVPGSRVPTIA